MPLDNISFNSNYRFQTSFYNFGKIEELIFSKVNPVENVLKLQNTEQDRSVYPMIDEYGYKYDERFIFKSTWDSEFYILTNNQIE